MFRDRNRVTCLILVCAAAALVIGAAADQQDRLLDTQINLSIKAGTLPDVLDRIVKMTGLSYAIAGAPSDQREDLSLQGPLGFVLERIADEYDYYWRISKGGVLLFNKRFQKNEEDRPQMILDEVRQSATDAVKVLGTATFDHEHLGWIRTMRSLTVAFTPEQRQFLLSGNKIYLSELPPDQYRLATGCIFNATFAGPVYSWEGFRLRLDRIHGSHLVAEQNTWFRGDNPPPQFLLSIRPRFPGREEGSDLIYPPTGVTSTNHARPL